MYNFELEDPRLTKARERLARFRKMSQEEKLAELVKCGIYTADGKLTPPYRSDDEAVVAE